MCKKVFITLKGQHSNTCQWEFLFLLNPVFSAGNNYSVRGQCLWFPHFLVQGNFFFPMFCCHFSAPFVIETGGLEDYKSFQQNRKAAFGCRAFWLSLEFLSGYEEAGNLGRDFLHHRKFCMQLAELPAALSSYKDRIGLYFSKGRSSRSVLQGEESFWEFLLVLYPSSNFGH